MFKTPFRIAATTLLAGSLVAVGSSAFAADAIITGGNLTLTAPTAANFATVALDGTAKTTTAALSAFAVNDARGSGAGWNVTAQATTFTTADATPRTLANNALSVSAPSVVANGTDSALPTVTAGSYAIGVGAVKIASAAVNAGMGQYDFGATTMTLSLPASVYAGTYTSTVTVSVTSGP